MTRKILVVSPFPPRRDGFHGGTQAIAFTIAELAGSNAVRLLCLRGSGEPATEPALCDLCESVEEIRRPAGIGRARRLISSMLAGRPFWVEQWNVDAFRRRMRETVRLWRPDVVQFEFEAMAQYRDAAEGCPTVLVVHEPGAAAAGDRARLGPAWQRPLRRRDAAAWRIYERAILPRFDAVVAFTPRDRDELARHASPDRIAVIPPAYPRAP